MCRSAGPDVAQLSWVQSIWPAAGPASASGEVGTEEAHNSDSCLVRDTWVSLSLPVAAVLRAVSTTLTLRCAGGCPPALLTQGRDGMLCLSFPVQAGRVELDWKGAEGRLQQLEGNGVLGCCSMAVPHPVFRGGVWGATVQTCSLLWSWCFAVLQGGPAPSQLQSWRFWVLQSSLFPMLPSPVPVSR